MNGDIVTYTYLTRERIAEHLREAAHDRQVAALRAARGPAPARRWTVRIAAMLRGARPPAPIAAERRTACGFGRHAS